MTTQLDTQDTAAPMDLSAKAALSAELSAGVDRVMEARADSARVLSGEPATQNKPQGAPAPNKAGDDALPGDDAGQGDEGDAKVEKIEKPKGISDKALARGVRAGFSVEESKQFANDAHLNAVCDRIDGAAGDGGKPDGATEADKAKQEDDLPSLDPDLYDDAIIDWAGKMEARMARLQEELKGSRGAEVDTWVDSKLKGLKNLTKGDAEKGASVKAKFEFLKVAYGQAGIDVADDAIFSEAAQSVLGSEMQAAKVEKKVETARTRSGQFASRANGVGADPVVSDNDALAKKLNAKFFPDGVN